MSPGFFKKSQLLSDSQSYLFLKDLTQVWKHFGISEQHNLGCGKQLDRSMDSHILIGAFIEQKSDKWLHLLCRIANNGISAT